MAVEIVEGESAALGKMNSGTVDSPPNRNVLPLPGCDTFPLADLGLGGRLLLKPEAPALEALEALLDRIGERGRLCGEGEWTRRGERAMEEYGERGLLRMMLGSGEAKGE